MLPGINPLFPHFPVSTPIPQYNVEKWEGRAYDYALDWLRQAGIPVEGMRFNPEYVIRGLIVDKELGNLVKADRFGEQKQGSGCGGR